MSVWWGYGSEHSMNLVMVGKFASAGEADAVKELIDRLAAGVQDDLDAGKIEYGQPPSRFSDSMLALLQALEIHNVGPAELEQLAYGANVAVRGDAVVIRTDETEVQAYIKIFLTKGARIEMFSAHDFPEEGKRLDDDGLRRNG